ncbi:MAG: glycosyltransferase family 2 protein [Sulfitobacter sp.]
MILGVTVVRNEADIIETMVRQNLHFLDHLVVIDNHSIDETPDIVGRLGDQGLPCELRSDGRRNHVQHIILSEFLNECQKNFDPKRVIVLDADEMIKAEKVEFTAEMSSSEDIIDLPWATYVPTSDDDPEARSFLSQITRRRAFESPNYTKVTIPKRYLGSVDLGPGSHGLKVKGKKITGQVSETTKLAHFPVRTSEQLLGKVMLGAWNVRTRKHRSSEAFHWIELAKQFYRTPHVSPEQLSKIAGMYAADTEIDLVNDPVNIHFDESLLGEVNTKDRLLRDIIRFTEELVCRVEKKRNLRQRVGDHLRHKILGKPDRRA